MFFKLLKINVLMFFLTYFCSSTKNLVIWSKSLVFCWLHKYLALSLYGKAVIT